MLFIISKAAELYSVTFHNISRVFSAILSKVCVLCPQVEQRVVSKRVATDTDKNGVGARFWTRLALEKRKGEFVQARTVNKNDGHLC